MSALMLRPGAAVETVEEGLLFSGWQGSTLMRCEPGVAKVWRAVEPAIRGGFEAAALRERLPQVARAVGDVLVATLLDNAMLIPAAEPLVPDCSAAQERTLEYLSRSAPDPDAAARRLATVVVRVRGAAEHAEAVMAALQECGIRTGADSGNDTADAWLVYVGDHAGFGEVSGRSSLIAAALAAGGTIIIGPCEAGPGRLRAAAGRLQSPDAAPDPGAPSPLSWAIARTVLVECLCRLLAGTSRPDRGHLVDTSASREVPLAPPRLGPSPMALPSAEWCPREDPDLLARFEPVSGDRIGPFPAPSPGALIQHPLARQTVGGVHGAGLDQARAGADAVLGFLRSQACGLGGHPIAGDGPADLLADAVGRLAVAEAQEPYTVWRPGTAVSRRWVQAVLRICGQAAVITTARSRGSVVARATAAGRVSWGYGADPETAGEHAVRGLLKALVAQCATDSRSVLVSHEPASALPLLAAIGIPRCESVPVEALHGAFGVRLLNLGGGLADTGILVGTVGGRS